MDAFTHFFIELALWNILLATLAFLFGLLMGHWMWGQFKKKLAHAQQNLRESEGEVRALSEEASRLRENTESLQDAGPKTPDLSVELEASRVALTESNAKAKKAQKAEKNLQSEVEELKSKLKEADNSLKVAQKKSQELREKEEAATKALSQASGGTDESKKKLQEIEPQLRREKSRNASLREVIAGFKESERKLKQQLKDAEEKATFREREEDEKEEDEKD